MIFKPEMVEKILAGEKTETRRPVKPGETKCLYRPGGGPDGSYAVQPGRTKAHVARIKVYEVRRELLYEISESAAIHEGFDGYWVSSVYVRPVNHFFEYWERLYGALPEADEEVWVIRFRLVETKAAS